MPSRPRWSCSFRFHYRFPGCDAQTHSRCSTKPSAGLAQCARHQRNTLLRQLAVPHTRSHLAAPWSKLDPNTAIHCADSHYSWQRQSTTIRHPNNRLRTHHRYHGCQLAICRFHSSSNIDIPSLMSQGRVVY
eukprot:6179041-Pleurochrysis_carterae.AAC.3